VLFEATPFFHVQKFEYLCTIKRPDFRQIQGVFVLSGAMVVQKHKSKTPTT